MCVLQKYQTERTRLYEDEIILVHWPALIRVPVDVELLFVRSVTQLGDPQWRDDTGFFSHSPEHAQSMLSAELIDCDGKVFTIRKADSGLMECHPTGQRYSVGEVIQFVQQHAAVQGHCCVAKFGAKKIQQAITLVEHLCE